MVRARRANPDYVGGPLGAPHEDSGINTDQPGARNLPEATHGQINDSSAEQAESTVAANGRGRSIRDYRWDRTNHSSNRSHGPKM